MAFQWDDGRYFLALARTGQIGKAAELLGVSNITLSRRLKQIQAQSLVPLWSRNRYGLTLSDEGARLVTYFERIEAEFDAAQDLMAGQATGEIAGTVRIAAPEGFVNQILSPRLNQIVRRYPALHLEIVPQTPGFSMSRRQADLAIMVGKPTEPELAYEHLAEYELGVYATADYLHAHGTPTHVEALADHHLIGYVEDLLFSPRLNLQRALWSQWTSTLSVYSPVAQVEAVSSGAGIGVLHTFLIDNRALVRILPDLKLTRSFYLVSHQNTAQVPRIQATMEYLRDLAQFVPDP
jgi:DNA-binding transcriptional LysR family regulator